MSPDPVAVLLERLIGLDAASLGPTALAAAVTERRRALDLPDTADYAGRLAHSPAEQAELIDRLVVPETWFFRGGADLFAHLAGEAAARTAGGGRPFRALCLPCSTGEEPYSLAIALAESGLPPARWEVEGIDLSPRLVAAARRGLYREFSLRQTDAGRRARYFRAVEGGWELDPAVRAHVRFRAGNVVDPGFLPDEGGAFDLILCRNLLIYLTPTARSAALDRLERLLTPDGLVGVGHAEPPNLTRRAFRRVGPEALFLFRREAARATPGSADSTRGSTMPTPRRGVPNPARGEGSRAPGAAQRNPGTESPPPPLPAPPPADPLTTARQLADAGRLADALAACQAHLDTAGPSADLFALIGVIRQSLGEIDSAAEAFRKALYLDPDHREALTHVMLLAVARGDAGRAAALRERLARSGGEP
jgi:chemotaxis protein methyltransferase WspC